MLPVEKFTGFMGSSDNYEGAAFVLFGIPMDFTVSFRPGARMAPQHIRQVSFGLEEYDWDLEKSLNDVNFYDMGDVALTLGRIEESFTSIRTVTKKVLSDGKIPLIIGGEHLITYPVILEFAEKYPDLAVVHFDAHADLRDHYQGEKLSHATVMRRVAEIIGPQNLYHIGIRSGTQEEKEFITKKSNYLGQNVLAGVEKALEKLGQKPVFISLDIDVVDPAFAPGTGTPEPGGATSIEIMEAIVKLSSLNIVGMDLVEVLPVYDPSERTSLLAAKILRRALLSFNITR
ncbi:agmatinase [Carboxydothermus ferrireducens]|uniref:Agmatinase n=1 Tax=Carboxydothermus ferrireducens DSM 11255 TaxID=1119529 RepID=A0ABX2REC9_9THEO|nr:agmatinase [Carboxydothermus ferrireducens]NYE58378.1 agmatinase [Carboxydothermus ferrireducens DSM 11255]